MAKWRFSILIILLALIGVISQQQVSVPNQEVVLQFKNVEIASKEAQNTIVTVKKQLQDLGADNIIVKEDEAGNLRIAYYCDADVASIKEVFSKDKNLELDFTSNHQNEKLPSEENPISFNLDVYEILEGEDVDWSLKGVLVLEIESKSDRFFDPSIHAFIHGENIDEHNKLVKVDYKASRNIAIAIDNISYKIPEVRAGPKC